MRHNKFIFGFRQLCNPYKCVMRITHYAAWAMVSERALTFQAFFHTGVDLHRVTMTIQNALYVELFGNIVLFIYKVVEIKTPLL